MCVTTGLSAVSSQVHHQYHFVYDLRNMTEAQKYCRERYTDLATIDNMEEVTILKDMAATSQVSSPMSFFNLKAFLTIILMFFECILSVVLYIKLVAKET